MIIVVKRSLNKILINLLNKIKDLYSTEYYAHCKQREKQEIY